MTPRRTDTDGFFVAVLRRVGVSAVATLVAVPQATACHRTAAMERTTRFSSSISARR